MVYVSLSPLATGYAMTKWELLTVLCLAAAGLTVLLATDDVAVASYGEALRAAIRASDGMLDGSAGFSAVGP